MGARQLENALKSLSQAIRDVDAALEEMRAEHDPLAVHIFLSRREYRNTRVLKSGKPQVTAARFSWQQACDLGFRGDLSEWERDPYPEVEHPSRRAYIFARKAGAI